MNAANSLQQDLRRRKVSGLRAQKSRNILRLAIGELKVLVKKKISRKTSSLQNK